MPTTSPGVTTLPVPSITVAPAGAAPLPTRTIRPPSTTTVAFSMVAPAPVITVALVIAMGAAASGVIAAPPNSNIVIPANAGTHLPPCVAWKAFPSPRGMPPEMGPRVRGDDNNDKDDSRW